MHKSNRTIVTSSFFRPSCSPPCLTAGLFDRTVRAQETGKTVADGVYSEEQATRGAASYDTSCAGCHRPDLGGANGPALRGERFARIFAGKDLKTLYTKIATTMPRGAAASLGDAVYLDIVAHVLRENGFPAGDSELTAEALVRRPGASGQSETAAACRRFLVRRSGGMSDARTREHLAAHQCERAGRLALTGRQ